MNKADIVNLVKSYIDQSVQGMEIENPKFDFKQRWYDLTNITGISEFLKDTSAIANTFGPDGFLVLGFNDKTKEFQDCSFADSGLPDTSRIPDIINKHVDRQFAIDYYEEVISDHKLGILHIPPSIDKPHVIRSYKIEKRDSTVREEQHKIFIRKNTQTSIATKYDLELMYYDRKNVVPEYELFPFFHKQSFRMEFGMGGYRDPRLMTVKVTLNIENAGRRPASICSVNLVLSEYKDPQDYDIYEFQSTTELNRMPLIVSPGNIISESITLISLKPYTYDQANGIVSKLTRYMHELPIRNIRMGLTNGQAFVGNLIIVNH